MSGKWQAAVLSVGFIIVLFGLMIFWSSYPDGLAGKPEWRLEPPKKDSSVEDSKLGPVQEVFCEGVNFSACMVQANYTCGGEGTWVPAAYAGDQFAMGHWIHDGGCYTGQSMLIQCKR